MAKYVNKTQDMLKDAVNMRIRKRMEVSSEATYNPNKTELQSEKKEANSDEISKLYKTKQMNVRIPQIIYDKIIVNALAGHDNNFTQYIKDLIIEDYERNKEYYKECVERKHKIKF